MSKLHDVCQPPKHPIKFLFPSWDSLKAADQKICPGRASAKSTALRCRVVELWAVPRGRRGTVVQHEVLLLGRPCQESWSLHYPSRPQAVPWCDFIQKKPCSVWQTLIEQGVSQLVVSPQRSEGRQCSGR